MWPQPQLNNHPYPSLWRPSPSTHRGSASWLRLAPKELLGAQPALVQQPPASLGASLDSRKLLQWDSRWCGGGAPRKRGAGPNLPCPLPRCVAILLSLAIGTLCWYNLLSVETINMNLTL